MVGAENDNFKCLTGEAYNRTEEILLKKKKSRIFHFTYTHIYVTRDSTREQLVDVEVLNMENSNQIQIYRYFLLYVSKL